MIEDELDRRKEASLQNKKVHAYFVQQKTVSMRSAPRSSDDRLHPRAIPGSTHDNRVQYSILLFFIIIIISREPHETQAHLNFLGHRPGTACTNC
jgi:hypothetical protein